VSGGHTAVVALAGAVALLASTGATALAAPATVDGPTRCEARLAKAAERRNLSVGELESRMKARLLARVDAALRAGRISAERAGVLRDRISKAELCWPARVFRIGTWARGALRAAASYLGLRPAELGAQLPGTSLSELASSQGKSVEGLKAAMLARAKARLARAVASGRLTQARADRTLAALERRVDRLVQRSFPAR